MPDTPTPSSLPLVGPGLGERLGIVVLEVAPGRAVATMPVEGNTQPYGVLHGGATAALAETVGSLAAAAHAGADRRAMGLELSMSHHRPATEGLVTATATAAHLGRTTAVYEIVVLDPDGRRVSTGRLTCVLVATS